jgi:glycosyltransferase involved in cell wall biosynthesis
MTHELDFSIVVPTWNRRETLEVVLPSLLALEYEPARYEVLLCDSGSSDGTDAFVASLGVGDRVRHLVGPNRGRAGARNMGVKEARGRIVLFTDADIIADPRLLAEHARMHGEGACAVVGREVQVDTLAEYEAARAHPEHGRTLHPETRKRLSWLYFLTGNASVPRSSLLEVGGFDESFTGYGHEDLELGYRLQKKGLSIRYNPNAINYHWHPVSFDEKCEKMKLAGISTVRFYNKHRDARIKLLLGWNPVSLTMHRLFSSNRKMLAALERKSPSSRFCSELVLQFHYLTGLREGLATLGGPKGPAPARGA